MGILRLSPLSDTCIPKNGNGLLFGEEQAINNTNENIEINRIIYSRELSAKLIEKKRLTKHLGYKYYRFFGGLFSFLGKCILYAA